VVNSSLVDSSTLQRPRDDTENRFLPDVCSFRVDVNPSVHLSKRPWRNGLMAFEQPAKIEALFKATLLRNHLYRVRTLEQELVGLLQSSAVDRFGDGAIENLAKHTPEVIGMPCNSAAIEECA
jgi:hypothetical protein